MAQPTQSAEEILARLEKLIGGMAHMIVLMDKNPRARVEPMNEVIISSASTLVSFRSLICDDPRTLLGFIQQAEFEQNQMRGDQD